MTAPEPERLEQLLLLHEALVLKPYDDATGAELRPGDMLRGNLTIGVGRNLSASGLSHAETFMLLHNDLARCQEELTQSLPWFLTLSAVRQAVLLDMCFNLGLRGLLGFKHFLRYLAAGEWDHAAQAMLSSHWAGQVGRRAQRLAVMMRTDTWPLEMS